MTAAQTLGAFGNSKSLDFCVSVYERTIFNAKTDVRAFKFDTGNPIVGFDPNAVSFAEDRFVKSVEHGPERALPDAHPR